MFLPRCQLQADAFPWVAVFPLVLCMLPNKLKSNIHLWRNICPPPYMQATHVHIHICPFPCWGSMLGKALGTLLTTRALLGNPASQRHWPGEIPISPPAKGNTELLGVIKQGESKSKTGQAFPEVWEMLLSHSA